MGLYEGIAIFANRRGFRFLGHYFYWLADRPISDVSSDPGDHVHLSPDLRLSDQVDFTLDTLTTSNRGTVLRGAGISRKSRRLGSGIRQFGRLVNEMTDWLQRHFSQDQELQRAVLGKLRRLIVTLEQACPQMEAACEKRAP